MKARFLCTALTFAAAIPMLCAATAAHGFVNSYNIDIGPSNTLPPTSHGAAANQTGTWNSVMPGEENDTLLDTTGVNNGATITGTGGFPVLDYDHTGVSGNAATLLEDFHDTDDSTEDMTWTINGLPPGTYTIYTYALAPDGDSFAASVNVLQSSDGAALVGGVYTGAYALGVTHALHEATVGGNGQLTIVVSAGSGYGTVSGLQIVPGVTGPPQPPQPATNPSPTNAASNIAVATQVCWSNGGGATSYDVYFGTDNTPDASEFQGNQATACFDPPGSLGFNTTYYWRIDAKNSAGTTTGSVWSFTTGSAPPPPPAQATNPNPGSGSSNVTASTQVCWANGGGATSYDVYFGTDATPDSGEFQTTTTSTCWDPPGNLAASTTYYWRIDAENSGGTTTGQVWSFTTAATGPTPPQQATSPTPANGASSVTLASQVCWANGGGATSYDVYFGTDSTPDSSELQGNVATTCWDPPGDLAINTTYYWRIDAKNSAGTTTGQVWSFTTIAGFVSLAGTVTIDGVGLPGVIVTAGNSGGSDVTDAAGAYLIENIPSGWSGAVIPVLDGYNFSPSLYSYANLTSTLTGQDFVATVQTEGVMMFSGEGQGDQFGHVVLRLGDVDSDGIADFAISAPYHDANGNDDSGTVYVYSGDDMTLLGSPLHGANDGDCFGWAVASGDLDGDAIHELIVGAPYHDPSGKTNAGRVYVYSLHGEWEAIVTKSGAENGDRFGWSVAAARLDSDGPAELIVGAPYNDYAGSNAGRVYVYSGGTYETLEKMVGEDAGDLFGYSVADAGLVTGDTKSDFIVGAPYNNHGASNAGAAYLYSGSHMGTSGTPDAWYVRYGAKKNDQFGRCVAGAGDINADGRQDFAVGAPYYDSSLGSSVGRMYVYSGLSGATLWSRNGSFGGDRLGWSIESGADVDGDGLADLFVGPPRHDAIAPDAGAVQLRSGAGGSPLGSDLYGEAQGDQFGHSIAVLGDLTGDGLTELLVGAPMSNATGVNAGRAYIFISITADASTAPPDAGQESDDLAADAPDGVDGEEEAGESSLDESCLADCTADGIVNEADLLAVNTAIGQDSFSEALDINRDGSVSTDDLIAVMAAWGACP